MLELYPTFGKMCNMVDPVTRLYPLQKAIRQELIWTNGVKIILCSAQEIISFHDPGFGLLPFQLAAESDKGKSRLDVSFVEDALSLSRFTVANLLRRLHV